MTRRELLESKRTELINELFSIADQLTSSLFETVEQLDALASRKVFLEKEIINLDKKIERVQAEE